MATFEVPSGFPHILLVTGSDIYPTLDAKGNPLYEYREKLRDFLYSESAASSPVRKGTHDFWIAYTTPQLKTPNYAFADGSIPMRGIVNMGDVAGTSKPPDVVDELYVMLQEVGHYWLVPSDLRLKIGGVEQALSKAEEVVTQLNADAPITEPPLLGRANEHWSAFLQGDASPMDGVLWRDLSTDDGLSVWEARSDLPGKTVAPVDLPSVALGGWRGPYSDLDLLIMGVKNAGEAYAGRGNTFAWMEPRLIVGSPYLVGIFVAFSESDFFYFGFSRDHRRLVVERTGDDRKLPAGEATLGAAYRPLLSEDIAVALRVVRRGSGYHFQARYDAAPGPSALPLLDGLESLPPADPANTFQNWGTVARLDNSAAPKAVGYIVRTTNPDLVEGVFGDAEWQVESKSGATTPLRRLFKADVTPPSIASGTKYNALPAGKLMSDIPAPGATIVSAGGRINIVAPMDLSFEHGANVNKAPKVLIKAPAGDFAFAARAKVRRSAFAPWSGASTVGYRMVGTVKKAKTTDVVLPEATKGKTPPRGNQFRTAFMIVANARSDITEAAIRRVDTMRRYWDAAFNVATIGRYVSDSRLVRHLANVPLQSVVTAVSRGPNDLSLYSVGNDGGIWTTWLGDGRWHDWSAVSPKTGNVPLGSVVSAVSRGPKDVSLYVVGHDGGIWSTALAGGKWKNWFGISPETGNVPLRSVVTAISRAPNRVDLFVVGHDGGICTNTWDGKWHDWSPVSPKTGNVPLRSVVSAVSRGPDDISLYVVGHDGGIWSTALAGGKWKNWFAISAKTGNVPADSVVTAISRASNRVDLFVVGHDGGMYTNIWDGKWHDWSPVSPKTGNVPLESVVSAVSRGPDDVSLYVVGHDGGIWSTALAGGKWKNWFAISAKSGNVPLRSVVTAISRASNRVDLFVVGSDGGIYGNFWDNKWSTWYPL